MGAADDRCVRAANKVAVFWSYGAGRVGGSGEARDDDIGR